MDTSPTSGASRGPQHSTRRRRHVAGRSVAFLILAVLGFTTGTAASLLVSAQSSAQGVDVTAISGGTAYVSAPVNTDSEGNPSDESAGEALNILLIGTDVRTGENAEIGGYVEGGRSDTTIIMHISADRSRVDMVSIPRDTRVSLSVCESFDGRTRGGWTDKFNASFANGFWFNEDIREAVACTIRNVTDLTGIEFNGQFIAADFSGFENMVDALGGVPMCIPYEVHDKKAKLDLEAGAQTLDGAEALGWARARKSLGDGSDIQRLDRQQDLMRAVMEKFLSVGALTDVTTLTKFVKAATSAFTMSEQLASVSYDLGLAFSLRNIDMDNVTMMTAPWGSPGDKSGDVVFTSAADDVWEAIIADRPLDEIETGTTADPDPTTSAQAEARDTSYLPIPPEGSYTVERPSEDDLLAECATE